MKTSKFIVLQENDKYYFGFDTNDTKEEFIAELKKQASEGNTDPWNDYCRLIHKNINNIENFRNVGCNFSARGIKSIDINNINYDSRTFANYEIDKFIFILNYKDYLK